MAGFPERGLLVQRSWWNEVCLFLQIARAQGESAQERGYANFPPYVTPLDNYNMASELQKYLKEAFELPSTDATQETRNDGKRKR